MIQLGLLTTADRLLFAALCERAAVYRRAAAKLRHDLTQKSGANGTVKRPEVDIAKGALEGLKQIAAAFGMTPADRKGLEVDLGAGATRGGNRGRRTPGTPIDSIEDFLKRREARRAGRAG
jgi:P27 family predicted phage terminase small subunit